ncbi:ComEA family DNA-binding protein [Mucilaginibacter calamicampi]|uniref:ComEA family DNA-binding protein n=1 Tax=Mucilaginibacter calamicampi TaxID=1302352 RepID=A0ABW2Z033_9SPHI
MKQRVTNYFSITKKEWNGTVVLVIAILLIMAAPYIYQKLHKDKPVNFKEFDKAVALLSAADKKTAGNSNAFQTSTTAFNYSLNKLKAGETIELNTADSAALTHVHGIGPSFAKRIIGYRRKLGGFIDKEQLQEVYGLDAEKYGEISDEIRIDASRINKLPINTINFEQLRRFPYLSYKQGNAIIQYRAQHGNYNSIEDMRPIAILNEDILRKIAPYIIYK